MASKTLFSKFVPGLSFARSHYLLRRIRPLTSTTGDLFCRKALNHQFPVRNFSSRPTTSSLNDPSPNWSNRPPKETIMLEGCDLEHWLCIVETPDPNWTRDQLIDHYIKILAKVVGSEEEARMKIYSVSTKYYFGFGANISEDLSFKLKDLPELRWVLPDSYLDVKNKDYGGEPFINGEAVPYDPKYHKDWVRNNARANERSRRNDRPRNFDRSRNFERRGEMRSGGGPPPPMNQGSPNPNAPPAQLQNATQSPPPPMQNPNFNRPPPSQGPPAPNVGYQNQIPNPGYQGGGGGGYQGGNPGYQPSPNPNMPPPPQYAAQSHPPQNPNFNRPPPPPPQNYYQGGAAPGYQQGGAPGYQQGGAPGFQQGGAPGYQANAGGYSNYQGNPNPNPNPSQPGGGAYPGGYQGSTAPSQGPDVPGGYKGSEVNS